MEDKLIVTMVDEDGEETEYVHVLTFMHEKEKYVALHPAENEEREGEEEIVLLKVASDKKGDYYVPIQSDIIQQEVFDTFCGLMEEISDEEDGENAEE